MFTIDEIRAMNNEQLHAALSTIQEEMRTATNLADYEPLVAEIETRINAQRQRESLMARVAAGIEGTNARPAAPAPAAEQRTYGIESPEYRTAFYKMMTNRADELTTEERAAYVATTGGANGEANLLPKTLLNMIWSLIDEQHSILGDITMYRTGTIIEIATHEAILAGDAATVNENAANDDEKNKWGKVTLSGKDFSKDVDISYAMAKMSIDAFEAYLSREIADRLGALLASDVVAQIGTDHAVANDVTSAAVGEIAFKDVANAFSNLKNANGQVVVYAARTTVYRQLVGMVDSNKRPIFQLNAQNGAEGTLIGAPVKVEDSVADGVLLIGYPKNVVGNMIQDIMIESAKDIKKHVITYSGYARFQCKLVAPNGFAKLTVKTA